MRGLILTLRAMPLVMGVVAIALLDAAFAFSCYPLAFGFFALLLGLFGQIPLLRSSRRQRNALLAAYTIALASIWVTEWDSRKPFLRALARIEAGMSGPEVRSLMSTYIEGTGFPPNPLASHPRTGSEVEI